MILSCVGHDLKKSALFFPRCRKTGQTWAEPSAFFMDKGWVKLHRKVLENEFCSGNAERLGFWCSLILLANHAGKSFFMGVQKVECKPGEFVTGRKALSRLTGVSEMKCERWLSCLEIAQQIEQQKTNKFRLIKLKKWFEYQGNEQENAQQMNNRCTTDEQQMNTNKNVKNVKNENNYRNSGLSPLDEGIVRVITIFRDGNNPTINYGNKTSRGAAQTLIEKYSLPEVSRMAEYAVRVSGERFAPVITTPYQLKEKLGELIAYKKRQENNSPVAIIS